ncbi:MAG: pyridoxamine 5'-phosphate oxidase [Pseudomonadota bacterium]
MSDFTTLDGTLTQVWQRLGRGVADRRSPARHPVLATVGRDGAEARTVVLRGVDAAAGVLTFHTDLASGKVAEIADHPGGTVLIWDAKAQLQMRLRVHLSVRAGTAAEWAAVPEGAQRVYGGTPAPGAPVATPEDHDPAPDPARFGVVTAEVLEIETLHLGRERHRRAVFRRAEGFQGVWLAP